MRGYVPHLNADALSLNQQYLNVTRYADERSERESEPLPPPPPSSIVTEVITLKSQPLDLGDFLRESMLSQRFADLALCCPDGHKFLAHRLVLSAASPYLQKVLLAHGNSTSHCEPITVILTEVEGPELAALLGFLYTGSARVPQARLEAFLRAADALQIRLPSLLANYCHEQLNQLLRKQELPRLNHACKEAYCQRRLTRRQVANQVTASPWSQTARPHHSPRHKLILPQYHLQPALQQPKCGRSRENKAIQGPSEQVSDLAKNEISRAASRLCDKLSIVEENRSAADSNNNDSPPEATELAVAQSGQQEQPQQHHHQHCEQCGKSFVSRASLKVHLRSHSAEKPFRCADCGKQFSQLRNYKYHRSMHEGTREFAASCTVCGKYFNDRGYLSSHMKIHQNRKEYGCTDCGKRFNQRVAYNMHVRIHTGLKPHQCEQCGKAFSRKMLLKQHLRTHSGERPYQCQVCHKAFADRSNMMLHTRLHSGLKPYQCNLCSKAFTKKHHLKTHLNCHTGTKPYSCPNCQITFSQSSNMRTHYKKCALKQPPLLVITNHPPNSPISQIHKI